MELEKLLIRINEFIMNSVNLSALDVVQMLIEYQKILTLYPISSE